MPGANCTVYSFVNNNGKVTESYGKMNNGEYQEFK